MLQQLNPAGPSPRYVYVAADRGALCQKLQTVDEKWQRARLFPVTGIGNPNKQERRGSSVLLAVVSSVKKFRTIADNKVRGTPDDRNVH